MTISLDKICLKVVWFKSPLEKKFHYLPLIFSRLLNFLLPHKKLFNSHFLWKTARCETSRRFYFHFAVSKSSGCSSRCSRKSGSAAISSYPDRQISPVAYVIWKARHKTPEPNLLKYHFREIQSGEMVSLTRDRHLKRYSIIAITLHNDIAFSHNAVKQSWIVIASNSYYSQHTGPVIPSFSHCFDVTDQRYCLFVTAFGKNNFKST